MTALTLDEAALGAAVMARDLGRIIQLLENQRAASSIPNFARRHDIGERTVWAEISDGRLTATKIRNRTVITAADEQRWLKSLPKVQATQAVADA